MTEAGANRLARRVLVVDDSVDTARMMKFLLNRQGFEARTAYQGAEALQIARDFVPEIVLLDLTLPDISGREVAAQLRKNEATAQALIIAISGYDASETPDCFDHMLVKPVNHDVLNALLGSPEH